MLLFPLAFISVGLWLEHFVLLSIIYFPDEFQNPNLAKLTRFLPSTLFLDELTHQFATNHNKKLRTNT